MIKIIIIALVMKKTKNKKHIIVIIIVIIVVIIVIDNNNNNNNNNNDNNTNNNNSKICLINTHHPDIFACVQTHTKAMPGELDAGVWRARWESWGHPNSWMDCKGKSHL